MNSRSPWSGRWLLGLIVFMCCGPLVQRAGAIERQDLVLDYMIYYGGLKLLSFEARLDMAPTAVGPYRVDVTAKPEGLLHYLDSWTFEAVARGQEAPDGVRPANYISKSIKPDKSKSVAIRFDGQGMPAAVMTPALQAKDINNPPPPEKLKDSLDPASAFVKFMRAVIATGKCDTTLPIFDGKRRYDLAFHASGTDPLDKSSYNAYSGKADLCVAKVEPLYGFKTDQHSLDKVPEEARLWLAAVIPDAPLVPVRLDTQIAYGGIRIHLVGAHVEPRNQAAEDGDAPATAP